MLCQWLQSCSLILVLVEHDGELSRDALVQGDERFRAYHAGNLLNLIVDERHEVLVVVGVELDHHREVACREVRFHYLRNGVELLNHVAVHRATFQVDAHEGAGGVADGLWVYAVVVYQISSFGGVPSCARADTVQHIISTAESKSLKMFRFIFLRFNLLSLFVIQSYHAECLPPNPLFELAFSTWNFDTIDLCPQDTTHPSDTFVWHLNKLYLSKLNGLLATQYHFLKSLEFRLIHCLFL